MNNSNNVGNIGDLTAKLQQLQNQVAQFNQMQSQQPTTQPITPGTTTYPKVVRTDTVEDILNNPQWKKELESEFDSSEFGARARNYTNVLFMEFCENQTGKPSNMLDGLRREANSVKEKGVPKSGQTGKKDNAGTSETNTPKDA